MIHGVARITRRRAGNQTRSDHFPIAPPLQYSNSSSPLGGFASWREQTVPKNAASKRVFHETTLHESVNSYVIAPENDTTKQSRFSQTQSNPVKVNPTRKISDAVQVDLAKFDQGRVVIIRTSPPESGSIRLDPTTFVTPKGTAAGRRQDLQDLQDVMGGLTFHAQRPSSRLPLSCISCISWFQFCETNPNEKLQVP